LCATQAARHLPRPSLLQRRRAARNIQQFAGDTLLARLVIGQCQVIDQLTGGVGSLATANPVKTVSSYWPYATTLFDYIRRAMPVTSPHSLSDHEAYALTAYILSIDGIVKKDAVLDAKSLPKVKMPNRDGFIDAYGATKR